MSYFYVIFQSELGIIHKKLAGTAIPQIFLGNNSTLLLLTRNLKGLNENLSFEISEEDTVILILLWISENFKSEKRDERYDFYEILAH